MSTHTPIPGTEGTDAQGHHIPAEHLTHGHTHPNQILQTEPLRAVTAPSDGRVGVTALTCPRRAVVIH